MSARRIRVSSYGHEVTVWVYPTREAMIAAASRYNGSEHPDDTGGITQATTETETGRCRSVLIRLHEGNLGTEVVCHEMHHAATALYGATLEGDQVDRAEVLSHYNEPFAYLYSDLLSRLVRRLYALGYYAEAGAS